MPYTGGPLNELNGKMGISAPSNSVPIMKLIRAHRPKSRGELVDLIKSHFERECPCGVRSKGTIIDFGKNLYHAQLKYWGEYRYSLQDCIKWEYDLFIEQSLKGDLIEKVALRTLAREFPQLKVSESIDYLDQELRIDLVLWRDSVQLCGVQVKPESFLHMRKEVIAHNRFANEEWDKPVFYLYYNEEKEFINLKKVIKKINDCLAAYPA